MSAARLIARKEAGKLGGIAVAWCAIYLISLPYLWAVGSTGQNMIDAVLATAILGTPAVLGFGFFGMGLGCRAGSARSALLIGLPILIGAFMAWRWPRRRKIN